MYALWRQDDEALKDLQDVINTQDLRKEVCAQRLSVCVCVCAFVCVCVCVCMWSGFVTGHVPFNIFVQH